MTPNHKVDLRHEPVHVMSCKKLPRLAAGNIGSASRIAAVEIEGRISCDGPGRNLRVELAAPAVGSNCCNLAIEGLCVSKSAIASLDFGATRAPWTPKRKLQGESVSSKKIQKTLFRARSFCFHLLMSKNFLSC